MSQNIDNIKDIDLNNYFVSERKRRIQKIKSILMFIFFLTYIIRYTFLLIVIEDNKPKKSYVDIFQYAGGIIKFNFGLVISGSILSLCVVYLFNYKLDIQWLTIIKTLKGLQNMNSIAINDENEAKNLY